MYRAISAVVLVSTAVHAFMNSQGEELARLTATAGVKITLSQGSTAATAYVVPRSAADGSVAFDSLLTQTNGDTTETFTWLNDLAYWSVIQGGKTTGAGCIPVAANPDVADTSRFLRSAQVGDGIIGGFTPTLLTECSADGKLTHATTSSDVFIFCKLSSNSSSFTEYLVDSSEIPAIAVPTLPSGGAVKCDQV
ncbi:hypothetical protein LEN26_006654 [Aphanomyces euteiches]|nr:hypothetical protein AeMF1_011435 [Aphanomyces euteiches]KAH9134974.1 hypothetical protein LEN26_006654 [Aphanomyces euteiches]KAH9188556.1 hypothetical protein AeNC1_009471 [Aphanomyces euteiches]